LLTNALAYFILMLVMVSNAEMTNLRQR